MADAVPPERPTEPGRGLARRDFEEVIRRATEMSAREGDADELLTEEEVLRIGQELGLSAQHMKRALYELPELTAVPRWYDRYFGPAIFSVARVVPSQTEPTLRRVEDYLVTREYLQIARRRGHSVAFTPADDTLSNLARAFMRPTSRHVLTRASRLMLNVQPLPNDESHVRFDVDLAEERSRRLKTGLGLGGLGGTVLGAAAAGLVAVNTPAFLGPLPELLAFGGTFLAVGAASVSAAAARFRNRVLAAKFELAGLLDRVEHGESLDPPPAPWRRRLQLRLFGSR
jgi:hypothetical protein